MQKILKQLLNVARLDVDRGEIESEATRIPAERSRLEEASEALRTALEEAREVLAERQRAEHRLEADLADSEATLVRLKGQQHQVASNEAYRALLHEMEVAETAISEHETGILELMDNVAADRTALASAEEAFAAGEAQSASEFAVLDAREQELAKERERLDAERSAELGELDSEVVSLYDRISQRRTPAAVIVSRAVCPACQVDIPPQAYNELLSAEGIITCGSCRRIHVHEAVADTH